MNKLCFSKNRNGSALVMSVFVSVLAALMTITMMGMTDTNTAQIADNKNGLIAYYAAEAGLEEIKNYYNRDITRMGETLSATTLPESDSPYVLANNAEYWVESLTYQDSNSALIVDVIGNYGDGFRKIRARLNTEIPSVFDDYGLLTDGTLTINGTKVLNMSVHGNAGLSFSGGDTLNNNAVATQSNDPTADPPHAILNPVGGYVPTVDVPIVPVDELRTQSQSDGLVYDIHDANLTDLVKNAPAGSNIYITADAKINKNILTLDGDMEGKTIFLDGSIEMNLAGVEPLSDVTIVSSGDLRVNGSIDIVSSHTDEIDVVFACGGDVDLNGSREFTSILWANGRFTQNGASLSGRVIASEAIFLNGSFILTNSDNVTDKDVFDKVIGTQSWQLVPMS